ncbi:OLC1v1022534C1 [Oldenlandia corymbosa var. corymbosa]|uniref:OLC1v1022534C1 n=1 Tax=Oldenlandia corymbosa var. corymbosa TaxID=529605 RepID=A0AAV1BZL2_OLDCO|nr:OLC1v1022534C1 [Oldenlandia corymbosa var. corymbosa]
MDLDLIPLLLTIVFILSVVKLGTEFRTKKNNNTSAKSQLPPGPWKLPLIGNLHQLVGSPPHLTLRDLANKYGPIMHLQLGEISTIVVSSPETAKQVLQTHDLNFASRPPIAASEIIAYNSTNIAFAPYGDYWRQLRKICTSELLSLSRVQSFRPVRDEETSTLMQSIASNAGSSVNLTKLIISSVYAATTRVAFGKKNSEREAFISTVHEFLQLASGFSFDDIYPSMKLLHVFSGVKSKLNSLHKKADRILNNIIKDHKSGFAANTGNNNHPDQAHRDLVDVLLKYHDDENLDFSLTNDNIKAVLLDIFTAGSGTSAKTVDWAMLEMIKKPRILEKAQEEVREVFKSKGRVDESSLDKLKYMKSVIKETLRLHPPAPLLLPRLANERCEINGYEIPAKTRVLVNAWAINRHPSYWNDAETFYPERFLDGKFDFKGTNFEYIPFGAGRRICPGIQFGMATVELLLAKLLYHFDWSLPDGMKPEELDTAEAFGLSVKRKNDLHLIPMVFDIVV